MVHRVEETTVIEANGKGHLADLIELWRYRDLFLFLAWRDVRVRYAQSILGLGWAVVQPVLTMVVFSVVFGKLANIPSQGLPYAVFSYAALVPWTYFSGALTESIGSLISSSALVNKVYFPRLIIPLAPVLARLIDFFVSLFILFLLMIWFGVRPSAWFVVLPLYILIMIMSVSGLGLWLSALAVHYRDVKYAAGLVLHLLMYVSPVVYPTALIPQSVRPLYALNPMAGVIEGFRSALLNAGPMPWDLITIGFGSALFVLGTGIAYFHRTERIFADVS